MKKDNVMFGVIGLLVGLIVGFIATNWMNRSALTAAPVATTSADIADSTNSSLPPNHPPIGTTGGDTAGPGSGGMQPQVAQAIEKAKQSPQDFEAQMTAADLYYQIQRFEEAAKFYEAAAKLKPAEKEPMVKAGNAYFDGEKYPEAEKWYTQALVKDPRDINVRTDLGLTFFLREPRDIDRAIREYKASLAIDPKHEITLQNLVLAYKEAGDTANYQRALDELRSVNPNNPAITNPSAK
ncbi:MAG TPA: tetratricopeptide repeat protein [Pyrinomonadaceae bacterium]|nr:tetratricopeptide repeat protein [Pyrinomonadaceae bacterium]